MATQLFGDVIFGPVKSRRLGISLGVNLLPVNGKLCNFDCIYCECGWNGRSESKLKYTPEPQVLVELGEKLRSMKNDGEKLDVITFAGNGEPTMHPDFEKIINGTIELRNELYPSAKVAVLSNATQLSKESVRRALSRVDRAILKIDSAIEHTINILNQPQFKYSLESVIEQMNKFEGEIIIQTMFLHGEYNGEFVDNTTDEEVKAWIDVLKRVKPKLVMLYSLDRDTPVSTIEKVDVEEMEGIAARVREVGFECTVSG